MENQWPLISIVSMAMESHETNVALLETQRNVDPGFAWFANSVFCSYHYTFSWLGATSEIVIVVFTAHFPFHFTRVVLTPRALGTLG